jgi:hypothetical protein
MEFIKADGYTQYIFNPHSMKPYDAILSIRTSTIDGYAPYDLTILQGEPSSAHGNHYMAAHGIVVEPLIFEHVEDAKKYIVQWYLDNRGKMYVAN